MKKYLVILYAFLFDFLLVNKNLLILSQKLDNFYKKFALRGGIIYEKVRAVRFSR